MIKKLGDFVSPKIKILDDIETHFETIQKEYDIDTRPVIYVVGAVATVMICGVTYAAVNRVLRRKSDENEDDL